MRDQTAADIKSGLYYPHYANLIGAVLKVYGEEASVLIDRPSLPAEIRTRHEAGEKAMRQKWLDGLSEEGRNRLSAREKQFGLNYAVLVSLKDLVAAAPDAEEDAEAPIAAPAGRLSESELAAREEAFLAERARAAGASPSGGGA
jgi:hypothetical protein